MKQLWITIVRTYIALGLFFYYKKISVFGKENIPNKGAVLFVSNHQNALIDPLIIGTTNGRNTHFLTRAGVFKKKLIIKFFNSVQMIPIYRVRDGWKTLVKNEAIFNKCISLLNDQHTLVIFPEGSHNVARRVRPLSKGFTRILFDAFEKHPNLNIEIVPVGLNYSGITKYPSSCTIYYGKPLNANEFWNNNDIFSATNNIKEVVRNRMKELTTHIDDTQLYDETIANLISEKVNFLDPISANELIKTLPNKELESNQKIKKRNNHILYYLLIINSLIPWLIWRILHKSITEKEFISTFRFGLGITLFPLFYVLQSLLLFYFYDVYIAFSYFFASILLGLLCTKFSKDNSDVT